MLRMFIQHKCNTASSYTVIYADADKIDSRLNFLPSLYYHTVYGDLIYTTCIKRSMHKQICSNALHKCCINTRNV